MHTTGIHNNEVSFNHKRFSQSTHIMYFYPYVKSTLNAYDCTMTYLQVAFCWS